MKFTLHSDEPGEQDVLPTVNLGVVRDHQGFFSLPSGGYSPHVRCCMVLFYVIQRFFF